MAIARYGWVLVMVWIGLPIVMPHLPALGYEEIEAVSGGTVKGRAILRGTPPPSRIYHMVFSPNIDFCTRISDGKGNRLLKEFQVSADGGFRNVVVAVVGVAGARKFDYTPEISIETCRIGPFVIPVRNHHPIKIENKDPITHDLQTYTLKDDYTFAMFNKPLVRESSVVKEVRLREGHYIFRTQCGVHDFMQSWGIAVGNPYFAVTGPDGSFSIPDIPPGAYDVIAWHPYMNVQARKVTVPAGGKADLSFEFDSTEVEIPLHALQTNYRLQPALDLIPLKPPSIELQTP